MRMYTQACCRYTSLFRKPSHLLPCSSSWAAVHVSKANNSRKRCVPAFNTTYNCLQHQKRLARRVAFANVEQYALLAALEGGEDATVTVSAWVVVAVATVASLWLMSGAFSEAKSAIDRRQEGERLKQQEEDDKEAARKEKIKQMFERL